MKRSHFSKISAALLSVLILSFLFSASLQPIQGAGDWETFLPLITTFSTLTDRMRFEIEAVLAANESELSLDAVDYNGFTLTIHFLAPEDMGILVDDEGFETIFSQINVAMNRVLEEEGHPGPHNFDYELFVNGQILAGGLDPQTAGEVRSPAAAPLVALSPGHGWAVSGSGWRLDRGYHNGIVEDFVNAELVMQLYPLLQAQGYQVYPVREMGKGAGNHASGHPWWLQRICPQFGLSRVRVGTVFLPGL